VAFALGDAVERDPVVGHRTPCLRREAVLRYYDVLRDLELALSLTWHRESDVTKRVTVPPPVPTGVEPSKGPDARFVSATCGCAVGIRRRRIRVARGSWADGSIRCTLCGTDFVEESLTPACQEHSEPGPRHTCSAPLVVDER
jgi:hypothetical protein